MPRIIIPGTLGADGSKRSPAFFEKYVDCHGIEALPTSEQLLDPSNAGALWRPVKAVGWEVTVGAASDQRPHSVGRLLIMEAVREADGGWHGVAIASMWCDAPGSFRQDAGMMRRIRKHSPRGFTVDVAPELRDIRSMLPSRIPIIPAEALVEDRKLPHGCASRPLEPHEFIFDYKKPHDMLAAGPDALRTLRIPKDQTNN